MLINEGYPMIKLQHMLQQFSNFITMTHGKNYILHHKPLYKQSYMYITETQKAIYGMGKNICKPYF